MYTIHKHHISHTQSYILILHAPAIPLHVKYVYHVPILTQNHHDNSTLCHSDIINSGLFHTLITSYIRANIYRFIYSTWLSKHYQKHTHQSQIIILIYIYSPIKAIL